jgi:uncharacterized protein YfaS (alpha-2-macroglobulin family)
VYLPRYLLSTRLRAALVYAVIIAAAVLIADRRISSQATGTAGSTAGGESIDTTPFFALSTTRTFGSSEKPGLWLDHRGVNSLDFRVYRVNDPRKFFAQLSDPHQLGEDESEQVAANLSQRRSLLERVRAFKARASSGIKNYFRTQLKTDTRWRFNQKFRATETTKRVPLNVADYARVPLLNPNQLVTTWREPLPALGNEYDRRMIPIGLRERGVYLVEAVGGTLRAYTVVVITDLAMVEKASPDGDLLVYAVDRKSGAPRPEAQVDIVKAKATVASGRTNSEGVFRARIGTETDEIDVPGIPNENFIVLASHQDNFAISDLESFYFNEFGAEADRVRAYIYTDRPIYRPNHKVFFKGILRARDETNGYRTINGGTVNVTIRDPKQAAVFVQELPLSRHGTFNGEFTLAEEAPLGSYFIEAQTVEGNAGASFEVAEYKKPEYKVTVTTPRRFVPAGSKSKFDIDARYFFSAPVEGGEVKYYIYRSRYYPWFTDGEETEPEEGDAEYSSYPNYYSDLILDGDGRLDASGRLSVDFDVPANKEDGVWDFQYRLEAQVTDSARRSINATGALIATRGSVIARAQPDHYVYTPEQTPKISISTTDYEGRPVPTALTLKFCLRTWIRVEQKQNVYDPDYEMQEKELASTELTTNRQGHATYNFPLNTPGSIVVKTVVHDGGRDFVSLGGFFSVVAGSDEWLGSYYSPERYGSIKLVPNKKSYRPGETARVLTILPEENANLLVTTEIDRVMSARYVRANGKTLVLDVPIESNYAPNVFLSVTFVKNGDMYTTDKRLLVPARDKLLNLDVISNKEQYRPRETASYTILARDADGAPVPDAEVSLGVVDEAIYSVSPDYSGNIRQQFYGTRYNSVETHLSVSYSFRGYSGEKPVDLASVKPSYQLADFKNEGNQVQPLVRKEFKDTAYWQPSAVTGKDGRARVSFRLPDNLTTWRATARAVTRDTRVGVTRQKVISRKDVILRLETPRFLTQGDTVTLSGIVHNYLKHEQSTQISISVAGANLIGPAQETVTIPRQGEHRVDWLIKAPQTGEVRLLAKALTSAESDAVEIALDVVPRGLRENKTERWTSTDENAQHEFSLVLPAQADLNSRRLRIEATPSIAGTLFGALDYLTTFPYGCTEQTMSSFLPNIVVSQTLKEFKSTSIRNSNELTKKVEQGRNRLYAFQHEDGGWGWWTDDQSDPFMTAYVIDGLTLAKQAGFQIDEERIARGRERLMSMLASGSTGNPDTRALMVYALTHSGGGDSSYLESLFSERRNLLPYGRALLALSLARQGMDQRAAAVANEIEQSAITDAQSTHWESKQRRTNDFQIDNSIEGTALSLKALSRIKPGSPLLPHAARWLVSQRTNGYYWNSTRDTAFAIFGLIDYLKVSHELTPSYDLEIYLNGETVVAERVEQAAGVKTFLIERKGNTVGETNHIRIVKRGPGTLYFTSSLEHYTNEENVSARSSPALNVTREYLRLKVEPDGYQLKWTMSPLTGEIHSGDLLVVRLHLTGKAAQHLMLEDPIPAGAEQLESIGNLNLNHSNSGWSNWYSAREFRDRRTVFFLDRFNGSVTLQYAIRVQAPGEFVVAPAWAELMYQPWIHANTPSQRFSFLDRSHR